MLVQNDFELIVNNCLLYNKPDTIFAKTGLKMQRMFVPIYQTLCERYESAVDPETGFLNVAIDDALISDED